ARLRFRPILMTSLAFILGAIPLVIATGAGANSRHSIGTGIVGGMTAATVLAIFFVPMFFRLFEGLSERGGKKKEDVVHADTVPAPAGKAAGDKGLLEDRHDA
ncbi:MAG TPA: efflux RND transporter permease subunit, partial [Candidatus Competibacteraceae bacterium]|nr:efflux RND transporter permease subunit [Candidatus Competibacteraceae bacterium]